MIVVGLTGSITATPTYENSGLGLYDRIFHLHGEDPSEWHVTQGQMMAAGNLAVEASTSNLNDYYWEVYHLMGDPSLMPYFGMPENISVTKGSAILKIGMNSLTVTSEPYAYVALSFEGELLDADFANDQGMVVLSFDELKRPGQAELVVTAQNRQPYTEQIQVTSDNQPYVIADSLSVIDSSGNKIGRAHV